ncbi:protein PTHB1 isoform X2 [Wyeomyia smithii]|uniref:protein PTHB1 isoform X2 n=1 Tax=Wyeomyia smithii TaxID=174621 RepID=UPI002467E65B|nr:protein PTHB1 isoform X2 [Wyeomyia smithii]XP_055538518.1 protein PTHB1 isoform X2 [Wyeomyia smithii]
MSLFKVSNWWKTQCPDLEPNYDSFSLHCARLCIQEGEKDSILVGSHSGYFSIYQPSYRASNEGELDDDEQFENVFQHSDVVLETRLPLPVIGITDGKFTTVAKTEGRQHIAILHPLKVCIYNTLTIGGIADHGDHTKLQLLYEHNLTKSAFSFCRGNFGGVKGRDFLCVQHLDGSLRFFEQDGISYECSFPGERNIPSPIHYAARIDCFVTVSPSWELECYRYQDLSETNESLRRHEPIWSLCIGEYAMDFNVHQISNVESVIVVMGENNLICVTDTGKVRFIKKLDYSPVCLYSFVIGWYWEPDARLMIALVSESGSLLLYEESQIVWSAELPEIPVALGRANVSSLPGALVTLGNTGSLDVGYLGSEPHLFKVPPIKLAPFEVQKCQTELMELENEIRSGVDFSDTDVINAAAEREVTLNILLDSKLEKCIYPTQIVLEQSAICMCQLEVTAKPHINLELLQICVIVDPALKCHKETFMFRDVQPDSLLKLSTAIHPYEPVMPATLKVQISCSYTNKQSISRIIQRSTILPLELFVKTVPASKEALHKVTLSLHNTSDGLSTLFPEFISTGSTHALGLQSLVTGSKVTVVAAKNTSRFRVQSEDLLAIPLIVTSIAERINTTNKDFSKRMLSVSSNPPIEEILEAVEKHHQLRRTLQKLSHELEICTDQMRLFERRFVVKLQERALRALDGILMLLKQNHSEIANICNATKTIEHEIKISQIQLSGLLKLLEVSFIYSEMPPKYYDLISNVLSAPVFDSSHLGWEQMMQPVMKFLAQTGPFRAIEGISSFDEKFIFGNDETFSIEQFRKQFFELLLRISKKRSQNGRVSADFNEDLEDLAKENGESYISEWVSCSKTGELPF